MKNARQRAVLGGLSMKNAIVCAQVPILAQKKNRSATDDHRRQRYARAQQVSNNSFRRPIVPAFVYSHHIFPVIPW
jgi:hypothetical protein